MALEKALQEVRTRLLLMDPDFFVLRKDWIDTLLTHVSAQNIGIFGSVWHPRWFYQYRDFPSVHFMLVDLHQIPLTEIDLKPLISEDRWWQIINRKRTPWPAVLRDTLKAQRCRDTGWRLYRRYYRDPTVRLEMLLPHYIPPENARYRWENDARTGIAGFLAQISFGRAKFHGRELLETTVGGRLPAGLGGILLGGVAIRGSSAIGRTLDVARAAGARRGIARGFPGAVRKPGQLASDCGKG